MTPENVERFKAAIDAQIDYFRMEYGISYEEAIRALEDIRAEIVEEMIEDIGEMREDARG